MTLFSGIDARLRELAPRKAKLEKVITDRTKEERELAEITEEEAQLLARKAQAETELEQLKAEGGDLLRQIERIAPLATDRAVAERYLALLHEVCEGGAVGGSALHIGATRRISAMAVDAEAIARTRLEQINLRIKEITQ